MKIADTKMESGYTFQQEQLLLALERDAVCDRLMCNPRITGFTSFAKAVLNFINDKLPQYCLGLSNRAFKTIGSGCFFLTHEIG